MKVYIAAPLYCDYEKEFNLKVDQWLRNWGYETYLPQRDGGVVSEMPDMINGVSKDRYVFDKDIEAMNASDVFLFLLDGRVPDEGACVALGYYYRTGKPCIGYKSDARTLCGGLDNLMIRMALKETVHSAEELKRVLSEMQ